MRNHEHSYTPSEIPAALGRTCGAHGKLQHTKGTVLSLKKDSTRREGRPPLCYKDTLKYNIKHCGLNLSSWEVDAFNRQFWRSHYNATSKEYEKNRILTANQKRVARKSRVTMTGYLNLYIQHLWKKYGYHELEYPRTREHIGTETLICCNRREMPLYIYIYLFSCPFFLIRRK